MLAKSLGVTSQAVSRWEVGSGYPDLEILPVIANFFNVTADDLLGIDILNKKGRKEAILREIQKNFQNGLIDENISICRKNLNDFPNDYELLNELAFYLGIKGHNNKEKELLNESIALYERILEDCPEDTLRYNAIQFLAYRYKNIGFKQKAVEMAKRLPHISSNSLLTQIYEGEELINHLQYLMQQEIDLLCRDMELIANEKFYKQHMNDIGTSDFKKVLMIYNKIIDIWHTMYEEKDYGFYHERLGNLHEYMAWIYIQLNDIDNTVIHLEKAINHIILFDSLPEAFKHQSIIFAGYIHLKDYQCKDYNSNASYEMFNFRLNSKFYDSIREDKRFKELTEKLKGSAKNEEK